MARARGDRQMAKKKWQVVRQNGKEGRVIATYTESALKDRETKANKHALRANRSAEKGCFFFVRDA